MSDKVNIDSKKSSDNSGDVRGSENSGRAGRSGRRWYRFPRSWSEVKSLGWKFVLGFILFYLIRDSILYLLIPYLLFEGAISL